MKEILRLLKRYEKAKLAYRNSFERDMPNADLDKISVDSALLALERAMDAYIDNRIQVVLKKKRK